MIRNEAEYQEAGGDRLIPDAREGSTLEVN
jgi:hypothetical protein